MTAYFEPLGDGRFRATEHTGGPWDAALQHAGPPSALMARALERCVPADRVIARITVEILGPVPVAEVEVQAGVARAGRSVELLEAELQAGGRAAMRARAWSTRRAASGDVFGSPPDVPPRPERATGPPERWPYSGYLRSVEWRFFAGTWDAPGPAIVWTRLRGTVVPDEAPSPLQRVLAVADSGSGVSWVLPIGDWLFINPELTVHVQREAVGEWISLDAETTIAKGGTGVARSVLGDAGGPVAYGSQSLFIAAR